MFAKCFKKRGPEGNRVVYANSPANNAAYPDNEITNTKYTWYNFVPKNLAEQFRSVADPQLSRQHADVQRV